MEISCTEKAEMFHVCGYAACGVFLFLKLVAVV